jgi:AcrR family transcriptional regulator
MARPRADNVRHQILLQTFAQIADCGVDGMSMRTLAATVSVSTGTINYYFTNKRQLLIDAITYGYERRPANMHEGEPVRNLHSLLARYDLTKNHRRTWWRFWLAVITYSQKDEEIRTLLTAQHHSAIGRFRDIIAEGVALGAFRVVDLDTAAEQMCAQAHGLAITQLVDPESTDALRSGLSALAESILCNN